VIWKSKNFQLFLNTTLILNNNAGTLISKSSTDNIEKKWLKRY